jgi:hypothetical protein
MIGAPPQDLADHGALLVRRAISRDDWISQAIMDLAADGKTEWTPDEWMDLTMELEASDMTIREFIDFYG